MFRFWVAKAEDVQPEPQSPAPQAETLAEAQPEPAAPAAAELVESEPASEPPATPEPVAMPREPTAQELEAAKEELVQEMVDKIMEIPGAVVDQISTAPYDPRFPSTNQSRHCFIRYNEFYKCSFERGADDTRCQFYKNAYESMCPPDWVEEWEELRQQGIWFGKY